MVSRTRVERGVPAWLVRAYLEELGGAPRDDGGFAGPGWTARVEQIEDFQVGSIVVGQVRIELAADDAEALSRLEARLERKLLRGGG